MKNVLMLILLSILVFSLVPPGVSAVSLDKTSISKELKVGESGISEFTVTNNDNSTVDVTVVSEDSSIVEPGVSEFSLTPDSSQDVKLFFYSKTNTGDYSTSLHVNNEDLDVALGVVRKTEGTFQPAFSTISRQFKQGLTKKTIISFKNKYSKEIKPLAVTFRGDTVVTKEGGKPVWWEGQVPSTVAPGDDMTLTLLYNTNDVETGSYTCTLEVAYTDPDNSRQVASVNFNINVLEAPTPGEETKETEKELKPMNLDVQPPRPDPESYVEATLIDPEANQRVSGNIYITVKEGNKELTSFDYTNPFMVDVGKKYCLNGTADNYASTEKCFLVERVESSVKLNPSNPTANKDVQIQCVGGDGRVIGSANMTIDDETIPEGQVQKKFDTGSHIIECMAEGYAPSSKTVDVEKELSIVNTSYPEHVEDTFSIKFNKETSWGVLHNQEEVKSGSGSTAEYTPTEAGNYTVMAGNQAVRKFAVEETAGQKLIGALSGSGLWILLVLVLVVLFVKPGYVMKRVKRKRRPRTGGFLPSGHPEGRVVHGEEEEKG